MKTAADIQRALSGKYGHKINSEIVEELAHDLAQALRQGSQAAPTQPPFEVGWMDSWVAHWTYHGNIKTAEQRTPELASVLRSMADLKFNERLTELTRFVRDRLRVAEPLDAGPPEPGTPPAGPAFISSVGPDGGTPEPGTPAGPASIFGRIGSLIGAPDGGPPEPGTPGRGPASIFGNPIFLEPEPPDGGPPEPGVPDPPAPSPPGPDSRMLNENPWVLYWFVSLKAPELLSVIDAHFSRRLRDLAASQQRGA